MRVFFLAGAPLDRMSSFVGAFHNLYKCASAMAKVWNRQATKPWIGLGENRDHGYKKKQK